MTQESTQPQDKLVPASGNESKLGAVKTVEIFPGFEWKEGMEPPEELVFNEFGFPQDAQGNWYLTRSARPAEDFTDVEIDDLYNRTSHRYIKSTFGAGLYFGNHVPAVRGAGDRLRSKQPRATYVVRFNPDEALVFSAPSGLRESETGSAIGKLLVRAVSANLAPAPSKGTYDRMFGDAAIVVTAPAGRYRFGRSVEVSGQTIKPKWAAVRDASRLELAGYRDSPN